MKNRIFKKIFNYYNVNNKLNIQKWSPFIKILSWMLIVTMLNLTSGCYYYKVTNATGDAKENIDNFNNQNKIIVLHYEENAWIIDSVEIKDDLLTGTILKEYIPEFDNSVKIKETKRYKKRKLNGQTSFLNEVHIYAFELDQSQNNIISAPILKLGKIEIYEKDKGKTAGSFILGGIGIGVLAFGVIVLIAALIKSSCPFIYDINTDNPELIGEIYSGSIQPSLERHDYLKIPVKSNNQEFKLKITNEVKEIQHTNLMELWMFEKKENMDILVDKYGQYYTLSNLLQPLNAMNLRGNNINDLIAEKDDLFYSSNEIAGELPLTDGVILEFPVPENTQNAKLVIKAKNSFVLDYMMGQFYNQFGNLHKKWQKKQKKASREDLVQWSLDQNIPLKLSVERNGNWEMVDYFNIAGPMAFKEDILSVPLNGNESKPLKVKLEAGNFIWEIDYVGIDYSNERDVNFEVIPLKTAITGENKDVSEMLLRDDNRYYVQPDIGDEAVVIFELPNSNKNEKVLYLHSKGWYQILRNPSGPADREYLESFRQPGKFNQFINEYIQSIAEKQWN